jgi:hypothetical protein
VSAAGLAGRGTFICRGGGGLHGAMSHGVVGGRPRSTLAWGAAELDSDDEMEQQDDIGYFREVSLVSILRFMYNLHRNLLVC